MNSSQLLLEIRKIVREELALHNPVITTESVRSNNKKPLKQKTNSSAIVQEKLEQIRKVQKGLSTRDKLVEKGYNDDQIKVHENINKDYSQLMKKLGETGK